MDIDILRDLYVIYILVHIYVCAHIYICVTHICMCTHIYICVNKNKLHILERSDLWCTLVSDTDKINRDRDHRVTDLPFYLRVSIGWTTTVEKKHNPPWRRRVNRVPEKLTHPVVSCYFRSITRRSTRVGVSTGVLVL